jgi:hypothetical protein
VWDRDLVENLNRAKLGRESGRSGANAAYRTISGSPLTDRVSNLQEMPGESISGIVWYRKLALLWVLVVVRCEDFAPRGFPDDLI